LAGDEAFHGQPAGERFVSTAAFLDFGEEAAVGVLDFRGAFGDEFLKMVLIALDFDFNGAALRDIAEDEDGPGEVPAAAADRGSGVIDREEGSIAAVEQGIPRGGDEPVFEERWADGVFDEMAGGFAINGEDFLNIPPGGFRAGPAGEGFSERVHEADAAFGGGGNDAVPDGEEGGHEPFLGFAEGAFKVDFVEGDFDGGTEAGFFKRFDEVAGGGGDFGAGEDSGVGVGGEEDAGDIKVLADMGGSFHAVHGPLEDNVHHDEVRAEAAGFIDGVRSAERGADDFAAEVGEALGNVLGYDGFVIDD